MTLTIRMFANFVPLFKGRAARSAGGIIPIIMSSFAIDISLSFILIYLA